MPRIHSDMATGLCQVGQGLPPFLPLPLPFQFLFSSPSPYFPFSLLSLSFCLSFSPTSISLSLSPFPSISLCLSLSPLPSFSSLKGCHKALCYKIYSYTAFSCFALLKYKSSPWFLPILYPRNHEQGIKIIIMKLTLVRMI